MAQHLLHGAQVARRLQYMRGEGVAQHVRVDMDRRAGLLPVGLEPQLHHARRHARAASAQEQRRAASQASSAASAAAPTGTLRILLPLPVTSTSRLAASTQPSEAGPSASALR